MRTYSPHRRRSWRMAAALLRGLANLLEQWPLFLLTALLFSPVGPHLRLQYSYQSYGKHRVMMDCEYLGARGRVHYVRDGSCPLVAIIDRRLVH